MSTLYIVIVLCCISFLANIYLALKLYQFSVIIFKVEDSLEDSLDILDRKYKKMNEIIQTPVFFDSVEIRQVISEIKDCHAAILKIANKLTYQAGIKSESIKEENSKKKKEG